MHFSIELKDVTFAYEGCRPTLFGLTARFSEGEVAGVTAEAGGGKSTFLKICAGLLRPTEGEVVIAGQRFWELTEIEQNRLRRRMGFDFQEAALIANLTVFQNLALPMLYHTGAPAAEVRAEVDARLDRMRMAEHRDVLPAALSAGLRRRVSHIRAVMGECAFFFCDEPTQGDDMHREGAAQALIDKRRAGRGALAASGDLQFLAKVADRIILLRDGRIACDRPVEGGGIPVEIGERGMVRP